MRTNIIDVRKELLGTDQKLLDTMIKRFELNSYIADAKYMLNEGSKESISVESQSRREKLLEYFSETALKKAQEKDFPNPEEFSKFVTRIADEILRYSWEMQKNHIKKKYDIEVKK